MKNTIIKKLKAIFRIAFLYADQHARSLEFIYGTYYWQGRDDIRAEINLTKTLEIKQTGDLYHIFEKMYENGVIKSETICLATYGWHSNGHLIEIGGNRYFIFEPEHGNLYLEQFDNDDAKKVEIYKKI